MQDSQGSGQFPVDNATYNLLQTLASKLEALDTYRKYEQDGGPNAQLYQQFAQQDRQHAEQLLEALRSQLSGG